MLSKHTFPGTQQRKLRKGEIVRRAAGIPRSLLKIRFNSLVVDAVLEMLP